MASPVKPTATHSPPPPCYPLIVPEAPPVLAPARRRARSDAGQPARLGPERLIASGSADTISLAGRTPARAGAISMRPASRLASDGSSNSSNSSAIVPARPTPATRTDLDASHGTRRPLSPRRHKPQADHAQALSIACSLFLLSRDTLKQAWLRAADINDLARNLVAARREDKAHARLEFLHRSALLATLTDLVRDTPTASKLLQCLRIVGKRSRDGDGRYLRRNRADIKGERQGDKSSLRDQVLTKRGERMAHAIHETFMRDPLTPSLLIVLHTCDRLLVHWYEQSRAHLQKPHEKPDLAFLDTARANMLAGALVTYGLMKLLADVNAPHAARNIGAVLAAAMRKITHSPRLETLLRRSTMRMSNDLKAIVMQGQSRRRLYQSLADGLIAQGVAAQDCSAVWRWLNRAMEHLGMPAFLASYFQNSALKSAQWPALATRLRQIDVVTLAEWIVQACTAARADLQNTQWPVDREAMAALMVMQDALQWLNTGTLRAAMKGFE